MSTALERLTDCDPAELAIRPEEGPEEHHPRVSFDLATGPLDQRGPPRRRPARKAPTRLLAPGEVIQAHVWPRDWDRACETCETPMFPGSLICGICGRVYEE